MQAERVVLGDSSSSLLLSLLLAQLHLLASAFPAHPRRIQTDFDKLTNQTRHLLKLTQDLLKDPVFSAEIDQHRLKSLPALSSRVSDLTTLEFKPTLSQLHADLKSFEHHFEWLNRITRKQHHSSVPKLTDMISHIKSLINSLQRQMTKAEAPRIPVPSPSLPPNPAFHWEVVQSSQELLQQFRLFCDWASRVFLTLKSRLPA
ncbi:interleukin-11 isoform X1 [Pseudorasbora parva]|uniref:interleukin-11 isoform X1 n=1 Tax=Pseudorasbora parva TaxID=51549 RepID=UPI00351F6AE0